MKKIRFRKKPTANIILTRYENEILLVAIDSTQATLKLLAFEHCDPALTKHHIKQLERIHAKRFNIHVMLNYSDYHTILLENTGLAPDIMEASLPWRCADYLPYDPEEGYYFSLATHKHFFAYSFKKSLLAQFANDCHITINDIQTVDVMDCALPQAISALYQPESSFITIDLQEQITRCLVIKDHLLVNLYNLTPIHNELNAIHLNQELTEIIQELSQPITTIYLNSRDHEKSELFSALKPICDVIYLNKPQHFDQLHLPESVWGIPQALPSIGGALYYA